MSQISRGKERIRGGVHSGKAMRGGGRRTGSNMKRR